MEYVNYSKVNEAFFEDLENTHFKIETKEDLLSFINDINYFRETGKIKSYAVMKKIQIDDLEYHSIRKDYPEIEEYFAKKDILKYLINSSDTFTVTDSEYIRFSTKYTTHLYPKDKPATGESLIEPNICLIFVGDLPVLVKLIDGRLSELNNELAFVIEGLLKGEDIKSIDDEFKNRFGSASSDKDKDVTSYVNLLYKKNCIKVRK